MISLRRISVLLISLILVLLATGCSDNREQAWQMINDGALLVDVRTQKEHNTGYLPGSKLIPIAEVDARIAEFGEDKSRPVVLYCASGGRAGKVKATLEARGFTNVLNAGGYNAMITVMPRAN
jgi:phage shock protein E